VLKESYLSVRVDIVVPVREEREERLDRVILVIEVMEMNKTRHHDQDYAHTRHDYHTTPPPPTHTHTHTSTRVQYSYVLYPRTTICRIRCIDTPLRTTSHSTLAPVNRIPRRACAAADVSRVRTMNLITTVHIRM
jgi:hypothetical protein